MQFHSPPKCLLTAESVILVVWCCGYASNKNVCANISVTFPERRHEILSLCRGVNLDSPVKADTLVTKSMFRTISYELTPARLGSIRRAQTIDGMRILFTCTNFPESKTTSLSCRKASVEIARTYPQASRSRYQDWPQAPSSSNENDTH